MDFDLDSKQTRRIFLAGTVAFPTPFPSVGTISVEKGHTLQYEDGTAQDAVFVVVQEKSSIEQSKIRVILQEDVAAVFFPGVWEEYKDQPPAFCCADSCYVNDLDEGEWFLNSGAGIGDKISKFLNPKTDATSKGKKPNLDVKRRDSGVKGIVFVPRHRPVLTIDECTRPAGDTDPYVIKSGCC